MTLYLRAGGGDETVFRYREDDGIGAFYWSDEGFGYAIGANADRALLLPRRRPSTGRPPDGARAKLPPAPGKASWL